MAIFQNMQFISLYSRYFRGLYAVGKAIRKVNISQPPPEMKLLQHKVLFTSKNLYGIPESKLYWFATYYKPHIRKLYMEYCRAKRFDCKPRKIVKTDESLNSNGSNTTVVGNEIHRVDQTELNH